MPKAACEHPTYAEMITAAIEEDGDARAGLSRPAIKSYMEAHFDLPSNWWTICKNRLRAMQESGDLISLTNARFKLPKAEPPPKKRTAKKKSPAKKAQKAAGRRQHSGTSPRKAA